MLVVDDEPPLTLLVRIILEATGDWTVREENRGSRTVAAAREFQPDVIVLDCNLPDASGPQILTELQTTMQFVNVPIGFMTGDLRQEEASNGILGIPAMAKPFTPHALLRFVDKLSRSLPLLSELASMPRACQRRVPEKKPVLHPAAEFLRRGAHLHREIESARLTTTPLEETATERPVRGPKPLVIREHGGV